MPAKSVPKPVPEKEVSALEIDLDRLDFELARQSELYLHWALQLAEARKDAEYLDAEFKATQAQLGMVIREHPDRYGLSKLTDEGVKTAVLTQKDYKDAQKECIEQRYLVETLQAHVTALDHKKKSLEGLVYLQNQNYNSRPRIPQDAENMDMAVKRRIRTGSE